MNFKILILLVLSTLNVNETYSQLNKEVKGIWVGEMIINENVKLSMAFEIKENSDKTISAVMHSFDQDAFDIKVDEIKIDGSHVSLV
ncbi:MAG: hypothetical protein ACOCVN_00940, partial [bacterium]